jgi:hypothetical protein
MIPTDQLAAPFVDPGLDSALGGGLIPYQVQGSILQVPVNSILTNSEVFPRQAVALASKPLVQRVERVRDGLTFGRRAFGESRQHGTRARPVHARIHLDALGGANDRTTAFV